jgi:hypothetical protein
MKSRASGPTIDLGLRADPVILFVQISGSFGEELE